MGLYYKRPTAVEAVSFHEIANEAILRGDKYFVWRGAIFTRTSDATFLVYCSDGNQYSVDSDDVVVFEPTGIEVYRSGVFEELYKPAMTDETTS